MRKLYKSRYDKKLAGVCGGLGTYFSIDPNLFRLLLVFLSTLTLFLPFLIIYLVMAAILPIEPVGAPALAFRRLYRSRTVRMFSGICGGLSHMYNLDPRLIRLIMIVVMVVSGFFPMIITYIVGSSIIAEKKI